MAELELTLTREQIARRDLGTTEAAAATSRMLALLFLATIFAVPVVQISSELRDSFAARRTIAAPQCCDIFTSAAHAARVAATTDGPLIGRVFAANRALVADIRRYEDELEDRSLLRQALLPPTQAFLSRYAGAGNEQVLCGRDGWLFYRADVDYVTHPGFLVRHRLPDPVETVADFAVQLARRDITLVLLPAPAKPTVHPEMFSARCGGEPVQNPSHDEFIRRVRARFADRMRAEPRPRAGGLLVFDPAPLLADRKRESGLPQYLETDTHWRPEAMELCAARLARFIGPLLGPSDRRIAFKRRTEDVSNSGDLARMLALPPGDRLYPAETVRIHPVFDPQDATWQPDRDAEVLLLGDSFTNVYAFDAMGWGFSAGLAEQLSYQLGRLVDRIVRNDAGASATRALLAAELAKGRDRLAGRKVVVWEFAARELAEGDWRPIEMKVGRPRTDGFLELHGADETIIMGTVAAMTPVPRPRSKPYADYLLAVHLTDVKDARREPAAAQAVVYLWGMRANVWAPAARLRTDQHVRIRVRSWERAKETDPALATLHRGELGPELDLEPALWGILADDAGQPVRDK